VRRVQEIVQKKTGIAIREIRVGGGGSRSDMVVQIAADMFNLPAVRMATAEISALGAAMEAAVATGIYANFEEAVAAMVRKGKTFAPNQQSHSIYSQLFNEVYKKSFDTMEPMYRKMAKITGYPQED